MCLFIETCQSWHLLLQKHSSPRTISHWHLENVIIFNSGEQRGKGNQNCKAGDFYPASPTLKSESYFQDGWAAARGRTSLSLPGKRMALPSGSCLFLGTHVSPGFPLLPDLQGLCPGNHSKLMVPWKITKCFLSSMLVCSLKCWGKAIKFWSRCSLSQAWHAES